MQPLATILLLAGAAAIVAPSLAAADTTPAINATCSAMNYYSSPGYGYCVDLLSSDPEGAAAADTRTLAVVAANATARNVTSTLRILGDLIEDLGRCVRFYQHMEIAVAGALGDLRVGDGPSDRNTSNKLYQASLVPENCDIILSGEGRGITREDPLSKENTENVVLARLATNIALLLK